MVSECVFYAISTRCVKSIVLILRRRTEEMSKGKIKGKEGRIKAGRAKAVKARKEVKVEQKRLKKRQGRT